MSDLIERLRFVHGGGPYDLEAADEIERLTGAVSGLRQNRDMANERIAKLESEYSKMELCNCPVRYVLHYKDCPALQEADDVKI